MLMNIDMATKDTSLGLNIPRAHSLCDLLLSLYGRYVASTGMIRVVKPDGMQVFKLVLFLALCT